MDDLWTLAIGIAIGTVACYAMHKGGQASAGGYKGYEPTDFANAYVAFGHDEARGGYNTSDVWDTRDRLSFSDNQLYNKTPFIQLKSTTDWDPNHLDFAQAYGPPDADSPRPRLEHFLDAEVRAW